MSVLSHHTGESTNSELTHQVPLTNLATTDSPEPLRRLSPATGHETEMLEVEDPNLSYDAETFP